MEGGGTDGRKLTHKCCGLSYNAVVVWHLTCIMVARDLKTYNKVGNSVRKMLVSLCLTLLHPAEQVCQQSQSTVKHLDGCMERGILGCNCTAQEWSCHNPAALCTAYSNTGTG